MGQACVAIPRKGRTHEAQNRSRRHPRAELTVQLFTATAASPAQSASPGGLYVALGDSVADGPDTYVARLFPHYQSTLGVTEQSNRATVGETSGSLRTDGQLDRALADINSASDTRAVTIDIGANDRECRGRWIPPLPLQPLRHASRAGA